MKIDLENIFTANLPADSNDTNQVRQVFNACFSYVNPTPTSNPKLIHYTKEVAELIGISDEDVN
mgnify:FL=1